jgi:hypothetical protein
MIKMSRVNRRFEYLFISSEKVIQEEIKNKKDILLSSYVIFTFKKLIGNSFS